MADVQVIQKEAAVNLLANALHRNIIPKHEKRSQLHGRRAPPYFQEGHLVDGKFRIQKILGGGGFGQIYRVTDERTKSLMAIKIEPENHEPGRMILEQRVLLKLRGTPHIPQFYASGSYNGYNYIVMQMLGKNLSEMRKHQPKRRLSAPTVSRVGIQSLEALKALHDIGYIHRDVKPSNICIGLNAHKRIIYIIDFGMTRQYRFDDGMVRKERYYAGFRGTMRYVSVTVHERRDQGPVDDLWSWFYSLAELVQGSLPWYAIAEPEEVARFKKNAIFDEFGRLVPKEMEYIMKHLSELQYHQMPDYAFITEYLKKCMPKDMPEDFPFDWEKDNNAD